MGAASETMAGMVFPVGDPGWWEWYQRPETIPSSTPRGYTVASRQWSRYASSYSDLSAVLSS